MKSDLGATTSIWMATASEIPAESKLLEDTPADVCIVGGIAGMTTAYLLA
jgi:ribulose 1,5-bisphosphate synthetase/thiazole synthase